jgi:hypothetical protein
MGLAPARPPRVPINGMMRNIDQGLKHSRAKLMALGGSLEAAQPEPQPQMPMDPRVHDVVMKALEHLQAMDASSAAAVLGSSPEAMSHPEIAAIAHALRTSTGIAPATKSLNQISQVESESSVPPLQTLQLPSGGQPQNPGGGPPPAGAQSPAGTGNPAAMGPPSGASP